MPVLIRPIETGDIAPLARLLQALASEFIVHDTPAAQAAAFLDGHCAARIAEKIASGYVYHVADDAGVIAGFIGVRERSHVFHLFVGKPWQRQGLSRRLWDTGRQAAIDGGGAPPFTVNASNFAIEAYQRLGFVRTAPMAEKNGIRFNPMRWEQA